MLVADSSPLFLHGLRQVLSQTFPHCPLFEATSPAELHHAMSHRPALVLLAASLTHTPELLLTLLTQLRQLHAPVKALLFLEPAAGFRLTSQQALRRQVSGLLTRGATPAQVCDAIRAALQWDQPDTPPEPVIPTRSVSQGGQHPVAGSFTPRQLEILHLIAEDCSNEEIADALCTSVRTVEYHRSQMLNRIGSRTTLGLVLFAQRQGLLPPPSASPLPPARLVARR